MFRPPINFSDALLGKFHVSDFFSLHKSLTCLVAEVQFLSSRKSSTFLCKAAANPCLHHNIGSSQLHEPRQKCSKILNSSLKG